VLVAPQWRHWLYTITLCNNSFFIILCSTILNYIYYLCALKIVASGINDIIVQTIIKNLLLTKDKLQGVSIRLSSEVMY
jgi:type III secretory pathway component EscU